MSDDDSNLGEALAARNAARAALTQRLEAVRGGLADQGIGSRVRHDAAVRVQEVAEETVAVVRESRWIVAATLAVLLGWLLRNPIGSAFRRVANRVGPGEPRVSWQRFRDWTVRKAKL